MKRMIGLLLALLLLVPVCALAELRRGDSGEEVTALQQMLWDTGFIFEEPDGVFGRNTEKAVKWFQEYANLEQSGIVDDRTLDSLYACWLRIMDENDAYMYLPDDEPELQPNSFIPDYDVEGDYATSTLRYIRARPRPRRRPPPSPATAPCGSWASQTCSSPPTAPPSPRSASPIPGWTRAGAG